MSVLVTIPAFNEASRITGCIEALKKSLDPARFQIAVAEDGSTDGSRELLLSLTSSYPEILVSTSEQRLGRGTALKRLWTSHNAEIYCYVDADLPAGPDSVARLVERVELGADVAIGSRYCPEALVNRPPVVKLASKVYNWSLRWSFNDRIWDHQCGLKAFRRDSFIRLANLVVDGVWFWDTEMLVLARFLGMRVDEVPMRWVERRYSRTNFRRLAKEVPYFLRNTLRLRETLERTGPSETVTCHPSDSAV